MRRLSLILLVLLTGTTSIAQISNRLVKQQKTSTQEQGSIAVDVFMIAANKTENDTVYRSNIALSLNYIPLHNVSIQVGMEREHSNVFGGIKWTFLDLEGVQIALNTESSLNLLIDNDVYPHLLFEDRLSYSTQLLISKDFGDKLYMQVAPMFIRQNLVWEISQKHNQVALGAGVNYQFNNYFSAQVEGAFNASRFNESVFNDALSVGLKYERPRVAVQLFGSNSAGCTGPGIYTNADGSWLKGDLYYGLKLGLTF